MGWTTPRTWAIGEFITKAILDVHIRDNFNAVQRVLDKDVSQQSVASTLTETTVYTFSVPGGTLGSGNALRLSAILDFLNNTGGNSTPTLRVKFGGTTVLAYSPTLAQDANRRLVDVDGLLVAGNATNVQRFRGTAMFTTPGANGNSLTEAGRTWMRHDSLAIDTTTAQTLSITVQHDISDANVVFRCQSVLLEYLPS